jgi:NAD(P)-dependent dehydrogenase (short-subunit alcohol dehydrogenase family)
VQLGDRAIVITGASGIAAAAVRLCIARGARVFVVSLDEGQAKGLLDETGVVGFAAADLTDEPAAVGAFEAAAEALGVIDGLFAVAGASGRSQGDGPVESVPLAGWEGTFAANTVPAFLATRETLRHLGPEGGSIVLMSSILAARPVADGFTTHAYASAKGAIESLTRSLAAFYASRRVRVNAIAPGLVDTPMAARAVSDADLMAYVARKQPLAGGPITAEAVAEVAAFLLSDASAQVTGQVIGVDGGWSVTEA